MHLDASIVEMLVSNKCDLANIEECHKKKPCRCRAAHVAASVLLEACAPHLQVHGA